MIMEQEVKWEVSYYTEGGKYQMTINDERVGGYINTGMGADRMVRWLSDAGPAIADVLSKELEK